MKKTWNDSNVTRSHSVLYYTLLVGQYTENLLGNPRKFSGWMMSYDEFKTTSWRADMHDTQVDAVLDFNAHTITIDVR